MKSVKIGNVQTDNNIFLAPLAGVTDKVFRQICKNRGAGLVYSELISAKSLLYNSKNTYFLCAVSPGERPLTLQLFGRDPEILAEAAKKIEKLPFDILDINMGCPAPKIVKNGEGAALMAEPGQVGKIVKAVSAAIKKPVTVKIRKGINGKITAVEAAKEAEANGAAAVAVHGRMREQYYEGKVDLDIIRQVKEALTIPVFASGDVVDIDSCEKTFTYTGCDAVLIGRASFGNPWIFDKLLHYYATGEVLPDPDPEEKIRVCLLHAESLTEFKGETAIKEMRKHAGWYIKGLRGAAGLRTELNKVENLSELEKVLKKIYKQTSALEG